MIRPSILLSFSKISDKPISRKDTLKLENTLNMNLSLIHYHFAMQLEIWKTHYHLYYKFPISLIGMRKTHKSLFTIALKE